MSGSAHRRVGPPDAWAHLRKMSRHRPWEHERMTAPLHRPRPGTSDTQQAMRRRNLSRVMHAVAAEGPLSRAAVAQHIGLTRAAVSTLVDELIRAGLLEE